MINTGECFRLSGNKNKLQQAHIILLSNVFVTKNNKNVYVSKYSKFFVLIEKLEKKYNYLVQYCQMYID